MADENAMNNLIKFERRAKYSGMPENTFNTHRLQRFLPNSGTQKAYDAALKYVGVREGEPLREHHFIAFGGEPGRGKTHLAMGIGWHMIEVNLMRVKYFQVSALLEAMRSEFDIKPVDSTGVALPGIEYHCRLAEVLILDDLGTEKQTEWALEKMNSLIDYRWIEGLLTVFTTNLNLSQLHPRIESRIKEGVTVLLEGVDYRQNKAKQRKVNNG